MNNKVSWSTVLEKTDKKLSSWKAKSLSFGGRYILINSVLSALPLYAFSLFKVPQGVLKSLESIRRRFFWGYKEREKKICWVSWNQIMRPKSKGGLGIASLKIKNEGLLSKWIWRFFTEDGAVWKDVIREFYGVDGGLNSNRMINGNTIWGSIVNWQKNWLSPGSLSCLLSTNSSLKTRIPYSGKTRLWEEVIS